MNLNTILKKHKMLNQQTTNKNDILNFNKSDLVKKYTFGGKIIRVFWKTKFTKFDIAEYVKVSKKQRTNISEKKVKDVLQYSFVGYCINFKKDSLSVNTSYSVRNVLDGFPVEMIFPVYSPVILSITVAQNIYTPKTRRSKLYYLRKKPVPYSFVEFDYVSRKKTEIIHKRKRTIKKLKK